MAWKKRAYAQHHRLEGLGNRIGAFQRHHLWLVMCPPGLHERVWDLVVLAALSALERGRQLMYRAWERETALSRRALLVISTQVIADFWARLASFAALGLPPRGWDTVPPDHVFLAGVSGRVVLRRPADVESPPASP